MWGSEDVCTRTGGEWLACTCPCLALVPSRTSPPWRATGPACLGESKEDPSTAGSGAPRCVSAWEAKADRFAHFSRPYHPSSPFNQAMTKSSSPHAQIASKATAATSHLFGTTSTSDTSARLGATARHTCVGQVPAGHSSSAVALFGLS